jgi:hypothetical protein
LAGGYLLAAKISKDLSDFVAGLGGYEVKIRPLIKEIQKISPLVSTTRAPQTAWGIWMRNNMFALLACSGLAEWAQKYLGAVFADGDDFPLPEYEWKKMR